MSSIVDDTAVILSNLASDASAVAEDVLQVIELCRVLEVNI